MGVIHRLPLPTPFPVGSVNAYLLAGEPLTLVDPGPAYGPAWRALVDGLGRLGYKVGDVRRVFVTHHHIDHFGAAAGVTAASGAQVLAHRLAVPWLESLNSEWVRRADFLQAEFVRLGAPPEAARGLEEGLGRLGRFARPVRVTVSLEEGMETVLGGIAWRVLHTPGHSSDCACLYDPSGSRLLAGDYLLPDISSNALLEPPPQPGQPRPRSLIAYLDSLRRGGELGPAWVFPGHGPVFGNCRELIERRFAHYRDRQAEIAGLLARGPMTAYAMCRALFPGLSLEWLFLGLSEVVGQLDLLAASGRLEETVANGVSLYRLRAGAGGAHLTPVAGGAAPDRREHSSPGPPRQGVDPQANQS